MRLLVFGLAALLVACDSDNIIAPPPPPPPGEVELALETVASGLSFPVLVTAPLSETNRLYVVEKRGTIRLIKDGQLVEEPFLDIRGRVSTGSEQGLLGLAFHPDYASNGVFVINYTGTDGHTRVSSLKVSANPDQADLSTENVFLFVEQPFENHNGGHVTFGPFGNLFVGMGDGGSGGDPGNRAQDLSEALGKLLRYRIDDDGDATIPPGNPFVGNGNVLWGIWSVGLRNPWRFSFDRETSDLYVADVGQNRLEEVSVVTGTDGFGRAVNFGWRITEGSECFSPSSGCDMRGLTLPVVEYTHEDGCSITGGHVYRGQAIQGLQGTYFYADFCSGWIRSFRYQNGGAVDEAEWAALFTGENVTSFGEDALGELYIVVAEGRIYRIVAAE
jgi:glucose/arabinose dehydrogenase